MTIQDPKDLCKWADQIRQQAEDADANAALAEAELQTLREQIGELPEAEREHEVDRLDLHKEHAQSRRAYAEKRYKRHLEAQDRLKHAEDQAAHVRQQAEAAAAAAAGALPVEPVPEADPACATPATAEVAPCG